MNSEFDESCYGQWLTKYLDTLDKKNIVWDDFSDALFNLTNFGRSKYHNLILIGPANVPKYIPHKTTAKNLFPEPSIHFFCMGWCRGSRIPIK